MNVEIQPLQAMSFWRRKPVWLTLAVLLALGVTGAVMAIKSQSTQTVEPGKKDSPVVTLEFAPGDIAVVAAQALSQGISISGSLSPVTQATVAFGFAKRTPIA